MSDNIYPQIHISPDNKVHVYTEKNMHIFEDAHIFITLPTKNPNILIPISLSLLIKGYQENNS